MLRDTTKKLRESMTICYSNERRCDECIHYEDVRYPECMQKLIEDGCKMIEHLNNQNNKLKRKIKRIEKDVYLED